MSDALTLAEFHFTHAKWLMIKAVILSELAREESELFPETSTAAQDRESAVHYVRRAFRELAKGIEALAQSKARYWHGAVRLSTDENGRHD
ncbi:MAG: hypothetical protein H7Z38_06790 [Rubrivivax sp.]|nr:hypothetical protein [Pyrinomonadaceae bacterium]